MADREINRALLTTPPQITTHPPLYLTGNEYVSLPEIGAGGEVQSLNVLHMAYRGLLEFRGTEDNPLLTPILFINGREVCLRDRLTWEYELDWIPRFTGQEKDIYALVGEVAVPPGHRGCCFRLRLTNLSLSPLKTDLGWRGCWSSFNHVIFNRREIKAERIIIHDSWTGSLVLEARSGLPLAALALNLEQEHRWQVDGTGEGSFRGTVSRELLPGESGEAVLYLAVNLEADGAATTSLDLKRRGVAELFRGTKTWLRERRLNLADRQMERVLNRNLFFNYFFALGKALDTDGLVPITSRSPRYYVSAAFWSRDALLWSFPGLLLADRRTGREMLLTVFRRHIEHAGDHAHYINGVVLYPGFELDQLAAYLVALERYERFTGDRTLIGEEAVQRGLGILAAKAGERFDPDSGLYSTFLDPSDDPVAYPFLVYDNALLQRGFVYLAGLQSEGRWNSREDFAALAGALWQSIYRHGTVEGPFGPMFAWAVDGQGGYQLYDNPPGSLQLLVHYGFCSAGDPVYRNTVSWIRSPENTYFHRDCRFSGAGSFHCGDPWPLAACNDMLSFNRGGVDFIRRAVMDNGFCCETVDPETGRVKTGAAFASAAGFLAYALYHRFLEPEGFRQE